MSICPWYLCVNRRRVCPENPTLLPQIAESEGQPMATGSAKIPEASDIDYRPCRDDYRCTTKVAIGYDKATVIYVGHHLPSSQTVVIRRTNVEKLTLEQLETMQNEVQLASLFRHPCVMPYLASFIVDHELWSVTPFMHFGSCCDIIRCGFPNGVPEVIIAFVLREVLCALNYIHSMGCIHRSVTARHILIDRLGRIRLAGLRSCYSVIQNGMLLKSAHDFPAHVVTYPWLAGEIFQQNMAGYNYKSDVYSVGITALEMAYGREPYCDLTATQVMLLKLTNDPPPLSEEYSIDQNVHYTTAFKQFVDICLRSNPGERPSAAKLLRHPFLRSIKRKDSIGGNGCPMLPDLLHPVMPMDPTVSDIVEAPSEITEVTEEAQRLSLNGEEWTFT